MPNPVIPDMMPCSRSPVTAVVAAAEPSAPAAAAPKALEPKAVVRVEPRAALPKKDPNRGAKKGRKASCCPVMGLVVSRPVGDIEANI
jgi:hypothetical protein